MGIAKGSAAFGHEKQMTPGAYLRKCAKAAIKDGESKEAFAAQFKPAARAMAEAAYEAEQGKAKAKDVAPVSNYAYEKQKPVPLATRGATAKEIAAYGKKAKDGGVDPAGLRALVEEVVRSAQKLSKSDTQIAELVAKAVAGYKGEAKDVEPVGDGGAVGDGDVDKFKPGRVVVNKSDGRKAVVAYRPTSNKVMVYPKGGGKEEYWHMDECLGSKEAGAKDAGADPLLKEHIARLKEQPQSAMRDRLIKTAELAIEKGISRIEAAREIARGTDADHPDPAVQAKVDKYRKTALAQGFKPENVEASIKQLVGEGRFKAASKVADAAFSAYGVVKDRRLLKEFATKAEAEKWAASEPGSKVVKITVPGRDIKPVGDAGTTGIRAGAWVATGYASGASGAASKFFTPYFDAKDEAKAYVAKKYPGAASVRYEQVKDVRPVGDADNTAAAYERLKREYAERPSAELKGRMDRLAEYLELLAKAQPEKYPFKRSHDAPPRRRR
jgi:hypothetical protein